MGIVCRPLALLLAPCLAVAVLAGCGDDDEEPNGPQPAGAGDRPGEVDEAPGDERDEGPEPGHDLPTPSAPAPTATEQGASGERPTAEAVEGGRCAKASEAPVRIWPEAGPAAVVADGTGGFVVAGYAPKERGTELFVVKASPEAAPAPLRTVRVDTSRGGIERIASPGLARVDDGRVAVAIVDRGGVVRAGDVSATDPGAELRLPQVGEGADLRFAPAIAALGRRRLVAWTDGTGSPMRVKLAVVLDGQVEATHDVTPQAMGASAPTFADGASPPVLLFVDARAGVSPILRVPIGADGMPDEAIVAKPVGTVTTPPRLAVAEAGGSLFAGYTVVGNAATTAVGWIRLDAEDASPAAIVPGTGYGRLHVAAASAPGAAVFAADAPKGSTADAPREIHLRTVRPEGAGPVLALQGPSGRGRHAAVARRRDGMLGVVFVGLDAVFVAWARCDDG